MNKSEVREALERQVVVDTEAVENLKEKFRVLDTGPQLMFCICQILGTDWVTHPRAMGGLSITSDGFVVSGGLFIGSADDLVRNLLGACNALGLDDDELDTFKFLFNRAVTDWRMGTKRGAVLQGNSPYTERG